MNLRVVDVNESGLLDIILEVLEGGGTLIFPTDTVYGIGGNPWDEAVVANVRRIKRRSADQPFSLHLPCIEDISEYARLDSRSESILREYLPGAYTFLVPALESTPKSARLEGKTGVRVPDHRFFRDTMSRIGRPLFGTSVNRSGEPPLTCVDEIIENFRAVDLIVTGSGVTGKASAIIDLCERPPVAIRGEMPPGLDPVW